MNLDTKLTLIIVLLLAADVALMWKMVYGVYPWEQVKRA